MSAEGVPPELLSHVRALAASGQGTKAFLDLMRGTGMEGSRAKALVDAFAAAPKAGIATPPLTRVCEHCNSVIPASAGTCAHCGKTKMPSPAVGCLAVIVSLIVGMLVWYQQCAPGGMR